MKRLAIVLITLMCVFSITASAEDMPPPPSDEEAPKALSAIESPAIAKHLSDPLCTSYQDNIERLACLERSGVIFSFLQYFICEKTKDTPKVICNAEGDKITKGNVDDEIAQYVYILNKDIDEFNTLNGILNQQLSSVNSTSGCDACQPCDCSSCPVPVCDACPTCLQSQKKCPPCATCPACPTSPHKCPQCKPCKTTKK